MFSLHAASSVAEEGRKEVRDGGMERGREGAGDDSFSSLMAPSTLTTAALISGLNDPCFPKGWEALIKPGKMHGHSFPTPHNFPVSSGGRGQLTQSTAVVTGHATKPLVNTLLLD